MKLKRILASALAGVMLAASLAAQPIGAVNTFDSPASLIAALATQSLAGITSSTMDTALSTLASDVTLSENTVLYKGNVLGYWFADASDKIYADAERTTAVIEETVNGFNVSPTTLRTILADVNNNLKEVSQFTDEEITDWSSLIGKYDIKLGSTTIPASQWIDLTPSTDPYADGNTINISKLFDIYGEQISDFGKSRLSVFAWAIDNTGKLYIQDAMTVLFACKGNYGPWYLAYSQDTLSDTVKTSTIMGASALQTNGSGCAVNEIRNISVGLKSNTNNLQAAFYCWNDYKTKISDPATFTDSANANMYLITDKTAANDFAIADAQRCGFALMKADAATNDGSKFHTAHLTMFGGQQATYTEVGNSLLSRRLDKLSSMAASDSLAVSADGWTVNGSTPIEEYLASSEFTGDPAEGASMGSYAEFEPLSFKVVVPTNLPVYVSALGEVSTASNAAIFNKSNAAIKINTVAVEASSTTNWTLVDENPSDVRGANEFTFITSLTPGTSIAHDEALPFTYSAKLSPVARDTNIADLAVVKVTFDWDID